MYLITYQKRRNANQGVEITNCKCRQLRVTYAMPAIMIYAIGRGNRSNVPMIDDHLPKSEITKKLDIVNKLNWIL